MKKSILVDLHFFFVLLISSGIKASSFGAMKIYPYEPSTLSKKFQFMTVEQKAYQLLKEDPIKKDVNYLAVLWWTLFKKKKIHIQLPNKLSGGFTICQHVRYREIIPIIRRLGITLLFAPHAPKRQEYRGITVLPIPLYPINGIGPVQKKDILYSFIGIENHWTRKKIFTLRRYPDVVIKKRGQWNFFILDANRREREKREYQDVISRSRFSLCPRGCGPNTIRFWESLQAGAIPVLISNGMTLPKIKNVDWNKSIIRIPERQVNQIDRIIRSIRPEQEEQLRKNCLHAYELACAGENFVRCIREYYDDI